MMKFWNSSTEESSLINREIKEDIFSEKKDFYSFIAPSGYDTAWLAMVPDTNKPCAPMFTSCLDWVLTNQKEEGFWGECDGHGFPTLECLSATLACMIALRKWKVGPLLLDKGMAFIEENAAQLLEGIDQELCPRWFAIIFPAIVELARTSGIEIIFSDPLNKVEMEIFSRRKQILEREEMMDGHLQCCPLLSYLEALPRFNDISQEYIVKHLDDDGSLFKSPSATAAAFMATGNRHCLSYLQSTVQNCAVNGVPQTYPMDEELVKLCVVNQLQRLGLAEHFNQEIGGLLKRVNKNYMKKRSPMAKSCNLTIASELFKDSMAFRLLRMHGYHTSPKIFCWFLHYEEVLNQMEKNHEEYSSVMLSVYRATDVVFPGEDEVQEARSYSRRLLQKTISIGTKQQTTGMPFPNFHFHATIKRELIPWLARMEHLEQRAWIEEKSITALWMGKCSFHRLSKLYSDKLVQLAVQSYEFRQSVYKKELEQLTMWSMKSGISDMGFGREKTAYNYFAVAGTTSLLQDSDIRMSAAKCATLVAVADDFYDMEGSLDDLTDLTKAVQRWDPIGLTGHCKTIFDVLDSLVKEIGANYFQRQKIDITEDLRHIWYETFHCWYTEAKWSRNGCIPPMESYLETGMTSVAAHSLVLSAACLLIPCLPHYQLWKPQYEPITKLLMLIARLLNDVGTYEKEVHDGKTNFVLLYLKENPEANMEDSIANVREILDLKKKEFLQHALLDNHNDLSKPFRDLHLSCLKVFEMFYNSANKYDSDTELLQDIQKAIYVPLEARSTCKTVRKLPLAPSGSISTKTSQTVSNCLLAWPYKHYHISVAVNKVSRKLSGKFSALIPHMNMPKTPAKFKLCFV